MPRRNRKRLGRRGAGFTIIEVMVSLGIMTIGAMGIIALQTHTIRSNSHARQLTIGMQLAQRWVERLKQDTHRWNTPGVADLANTRYLRQITTAPNVFGTIPNTNNTATASRAFDYMGNDVLDTSGDLIFYCAATRPAWVYFGRAMRVDVRVWWPREGYHQRTDFPACGAGHTQLDPGGPATSLFNLNAYHVVYLSTVLRLMPVLR
jgi:type IV pilus modification protein PilV